jgi:hypothetical protein
MALTKVTGDMTSGIADESGLASVQILLQVELGLNLLELQK